MPFQNIFFSNIVIHRHPELVADYGLLATIMQMEKVEKCKGTCSRSIHSVDDLSSLKMIWTMLFWASLQIISKKATSRKLLYQK